MDKNYRIWSTEAQNAYADGKDVPWATQRCKGGMHRNDTHGMTRHDCKLVSDHGGSCECICGETFNEVEVK